jgi:hypothetical protein
LPIKIYVKKQENIFHAVTKTKEKQQRKTSRALSRLIESYSRPFTGGQFIQERLIETGNIVFPNKVKELAETLFSPEIQWLNAQVTLSMTAQINEEQLVKGETKLSQSTQ